MRKNAGKNPALIAAKKAEREHLEVEIREMVAACKAVYREHWSSSQSGRKLGA